MEKYIDRTDAGKTLAHALNSFANQPNTIVLALPRGGVPVAYEIAKALSLPLDVFIVRKIGMPGHEELALGAIATGNITVFNEDILQELSVPKKAVDAVIIKESAELERRGKAYRGNKPFPILKDKNILLVDDGIATGASIRAAIKALRVQQPAKIIVAVPVAAQETYEEILQLADQVVCPITPPNFNAVGAWYWKFDQTSDEEVSELLTVAENFKHSF